MGCRSLGKGVECNISSVIAPEKSGAGRSGQKIYIGGLCGDGGTSMGNLSPTPSCHTGVLQEPSHLDWAQGQISLFLRTLNLQVKDQIVCFCQVHLNTWREGMKEW